MAAHSSQQLRRTGFITAAVLVVLLIAAFNLQHLPGMKGTTYHAEFGDTSGLHVGATVEIAGIRVGRVSKIGIDGDKVKVDFDVDKERLGTDTTATIEVLNLLGEKYLNLVPKGERTLAAGGTIPLRNTAASYDIVSTLSQLTHTTEKLDTDQLATSLTVLGDTLNEAAPEIQSSFKGIADLSKVIADKNQDLTKLLTDARTVVDLIKEHKDGLVTLMDQGNQIFNTLIQRRDDIHRLLVTARQMAVQLRGLVRDNEKTIGPALTELEKAINFLNARKQQLSDTVKYYGPYATILTNVIGSGPWFDAYVPNIPGTVSGEFTPGFRPGMER